MPGYRTDGTQNDSFWHNAEFDKLFDHVDSELWYGLAHSGSTRRSVRAPDIGRGVGDHVQQHSKIHSETRDGRRPDTSCPGRLCADSAKHARVQGLLSVNGGPE